ncbi:hypothetical protein [Sphingobacterium griseoflavum]|uniref:Phage protein n=1 Tax=Sphingobacterium griseoflavum TaxID=1474952 RepID=A0ABQ3HXS8_9SPHI|nr:hypothetical protein [Sphingobacterium griseoflavum]GHE34929.1 hypothetical protein GCM10017764_17630 [Sphingobacterium griseoflavum]
MNRVDITFKGQVVTLVFGSWVMGQLIKGGYSLASLQENMKDNPFDFFSKLAYLGAVNALPSKDLNAYDHNDFYDWLDSAGGIASDEVTRVITCFTNSLGTDVSKKKPVTSKQIKK